MLKINVNVINIVTININRSINVIINVSMNIKRFIIRTLPLLKSSFITGLNNQISATH